MKRLIHSLMAAFCAATVFGQSAPNFELLSAAPTPLRRLGGNAISGAPEITRDGSNVLFLSLAANLAPGDSRRLNLYSFNRQTRSTTLLSLATNGLPANEDVESFAVSPDGAKILFETRASNILPNDTNGLTDVFLRDLISGQVTLISADTNGLPAGGFSPSMSSNSQRIAFLSNSRNLVANTPFGMNFFARDLASNTITRLNTGADFIASADGSSLSDDGRIAIYLGFKNYPTFFAERIFLRDLEHGTDLDFPPADPVNSIGLLSANGEWAIAAFSRFGSPSNSIVRYHIPTGASELIASNNTSLSIEPIAASPDGKAFVYTVGSDAVLWREGRDPRHFTQGKSLSAPHTIEISNDGNRVAFSAANYPGPVQGFIYNADQDTLQSTPEQTLSTQDVNPTPSLSPDGSLVAYVAESDTLDGAEESVANVFLWNPSTGENELVSTAPAAALQTTLPSGASHFEKGVSDDGQRILYRSLQSINGAARSNSFWNIVLLDRKTGQRHLVSRAADGINGGNQSSLDGYLSADGNTALFYSRATNLVASSVPNLPALYYWNVASPAPRLIYALTNLPPRVRLPAISMSHDGRFAIVPIFAGNGVSHPFLYNVSNGQLSPIAVTSSGDLVPEGAFNAVISPSGEYIAFQSNNSRLVNSTSGNNNLTTYLLYRPSGQLRQIQTEFGSGSALPNAAARFTRDSNKLLYPYRSPNTFGTFDLTTGVNALLCTDCRDVDISTDAHWAAFTRFQNNVNPRHVVLRDTVLGVDTLVTSNANNHSYAPRITRDGRYVVFQSWAANLVSNDFNSGVDLYLYDRLEKRTELVTPNANSSSARAILSGDSSTLIFKSFANNLVPNDFNDAPDVFAYQMPYLRINKIEVINGKLKLDISGQSYIIQSREDVGVGPWTNEPSVNGEVDLPTTTTRFYRVISNN